MRNERMRGWAYKDWWIAILAHGNLYIIDNGVVGAGAPTTTGQIAAYEGYGGYRPLSQQRVETAWRRIKAAYRRKRAKLPAPAPAELFDTSRF